MQRKDAPSVGDFIPKQDMPAIAASILIRLGNAYIYNSGIEVLQSTIQVLDASRQAELQEFPNKSFQGFILHSQFRQIFLQPSATPHEKDKALAYPHDIAVLETCPVLLASALEINSEVQASHRIYPPIEHGTVGLVPSGETFYTYSISELPQEAQERQKCIGQRFEELEKQYHNTALAYLSIPLFNKDVEVKTMVQRLAEDYYTFHRKQTNKPRTNKLIPVTSGHRIRLPITEDMIALQQSHGPGVKTLWNLKETSKTGLITPNNKQLLVEGNNEHEQKVLNTYVGKEIGAEGLKVMAVILSAYHEQTGGQDQKENACTKIRDLLIRTHNGDEKHADDPDEQKKLMHIILFFARTLVTDPNKPTETSRSKRHRGLKEYTPLLILESLKVDEHTGIQIPKEVEFHLGKDFYNSQFGKYRLFYEIPTAIVLNYHSQKEQQEIFLTFYLAYRINTQKGTSYEIFSEILLQSGLKSKIDIKHNDHRTRDALSALYALERIERDSIIKRDPHEDIDTVLATEHFLQEGAHLIGTYDKYYSRLNEKKMQGKILSPKTYDRVITQYHYLKTKPAAELRKTRLAALKRLLNTNNGNFITFRAGDLILKQQHLITNGIQR